MSWKKFNRNVMNNCYHQAMNSFAPLVVRYEAVRQTSIMFTDTIQREIINLWFCKFHTCRKNERKVATTRDHVVYPRQVEGSGELFFA